VFLFVSEALAQDKTVPSKPGTLLVTGYTHNQINIKWGASTDNVGVTGYRIERCQNAGCINFAQIGTTAGNILTFNNTGLATSTTYQYRVRANDAAGNLSVYSNTVSRITNAPPDTMAPTIPGNLRLTKVGIDEAVLAWNASTDNVKVTAYLIERCQNVGCTGYVQVGSVIPTSYINPNLMPKQNYSYRVRAQDAAGNKSGYSNVLSVLTLTAVNINTKVTYKEPTQQKDGKPLTNLSKTTIYYDIGKGQVKAVDIPATMASGGGTITKDIVIAIAAGTQVNASFWATATNQTYSVSAKSNIANKLLGGISDTIPPAPPQ
jgi:chitodextrinase